jgi:hypothetical protein
MDADSIRARIEQEVAALRAAHPEMTGCNTAFSSRTEGGAPRYSLSLDICWPQRRILFHGPARDAAGAAIDAAFHEARSRIAQATWASR